MFNWSEVHLSEMTCYKIHTLRNMAINAATIIGVLFMPKKILCYILYLVPMARDKRVGQDPHLDLDLRNRGTES